MVRADVARFTMILPTTHQLPKELGLRKKSLRTDLPTPCHTKVPCQYCSKCHRFKLCSSARFPEKSKYCLFWCITFLYPFTDFLQVLRVRYQIPHNRFHQRQNCQLSTTNSSTSSVSSSTDSWFIWFNTAFSLLNVSVSRGKNGKPYMHVLNDTCPTIRICNYCSQLQRMTLSEVLIE